MTTQEKSKGKKRTTQFIPIQVNSDLINALTDKTGQPQEVFVIELTKLAEAHLRSWLQSADDSHYCDVCKDFSNKTHIPNERTKQALQDSRAGKNLSSFSSLEEMWEKLGI